MEEWSASEANLFEEALDKYGKDFNDIRQVSEFARSDKFTINEGVMTTSTT